MFVRRIVARVWRSKLLVGPCIACSFRSGVALALEILFFAPLSIVTKQEPSFWHSTEIGSSCFPFGFLIYAGTVVLPVSSSSLRLLHSLPSRAPVDCNEARALLNVSLTHPRAANYLTDAAAMQGSAAAKCDALKYRGNNGHYHPGSED